MSSMNKENSPRIRYVYRAICSGVLIAIAWSMFITIWISFTSANNHTGYLLGIGNLSVHSLIYCTLIVINGRLLRAFKIGVERMTNQIASIVLTVCIADFFELFVSIAILNDFRYILALSWRYLFLAFCQSSVLALAMILMVYLYRRIVPPLPVALVYGEYDNDIEGKLAHLPHKYRITKRIRYNDPDIDLEQLVRTCDGVIINDVPAKVENLIIKYCFDNDTRVYVVPKIADIILKSSDNLNVIDTPLFLSRNLGMSLGQRFFKRTMDIVLCSLAVIVLSPVFIITAIAIKLEDHGPVFFKQERVTKDGKHFMILKFRSMIVDAEKDGRPHPAGEKDDRITKVGNIIRACRIDELPQLFNILSGDMSIVGPRPERYEHVEKYTNDIPEFKYREKVKGGLTGYAQVYGKYNTTALDKLKLDLIYITNYSITLDIQIIFETLKVLFQKESTEGFDIERAKEMHDADIEVEDK